MRIKELTVMLIASLVRIAKSKIKYNRLTVKMGIFSSKGNV